MIPILSLSDSTILCLKPAGIPSQSAPGQKEDMVSLLFRQTGGPVFPVHRLDQGVGGIMVFARTRAAAAVLSAAVQDRRLEKRYLAIVRGTPQPEEGRYTDLLFKDSTRGKTFVVTRMRKGVKEASLSYRTLGTAEGLSLIEVKLHTGRTHQIRVQFSSRGMPLEGDRKYGGSPGPLCLWSFSLAFPGGGIPPFSAAALPQGGLWESFRPQLDAVRNCSPVVG